MIKEVECALKEHLKAQASMLIVIEIFHDELLLAKFKTFLKAEALSLNASFASILHMLPSSALQLLLPPPLASQRSPLEN